MSLLDKRPNYQFTPARNCSPEYHTNQSPRQQWLLFFRQVCIPVYLPKTNRYGVSCLRKRINEVAKPTDTTETRISSHHERVEVQVHEGNPSNGTSNLEVNISELEFSPGQLELQRRVALAQSKREVITSGP